MASMMSDAVALQIMLVEDDPMFLQFYQMFLAQHSVHCYAHSSLSSAEQWLLQTEVKLDAVLLDNQLDDGEGLRLMPLIQQRQRDAAVIMVSANEEHEFFLEAFSRGIDDYAVKPVNMALLWVKLGQAVNKRQLMRANLQQQQQLQQWVQLEQREQQLARHVFQAMTHRETQSVPEIYAWLQASSMFSGDMLLQHQAADGSLYVLLADAMGHGLAAAVSLLPLIDEFRRGAAAVLPLSNLVYAMNNRLEQQLPAGHFVAAIALRIQPQLNIIELWNGGMPPVLLLRQDLRQERSSAKHMALGILSPQQLDVSVVRMPLAGLRQMALYSDGLIETKAVNGQNLTIDALAGYLSEGNAIEQVLQLQQLLLRNHELPDDDISLALIDCVALYQKSQQQPAVLPPISGLMQGHFRLEGATLMQAELPAIIMTWFEQQQLPRPLCQRAFTVLTELYTNAYEHGVLQLDSKIKQADEGFYQFYQLKQHAALHISPDAFIDIRLCWQPLSQQLQLEIQDSGAGFTWPEGVSQDAFFGRGLLLVQQLAQSLQVKTPGNHILVTLNG